MYIAAEKLSLYINAQCNTWHSAKFLYECLGREPNPRTQGLVVAKFKHKKEGENICKFMVLTKMCRVGH
jgi:hypothetical protein